MEEARNAWLLPKMLDMRDPTVHKKKIETAFTDHLIGDMHIAVSRILSLRYVHLCSLSVAPHAATQARKQRALLRGILIVPLPLIVLLVRSGRTARELGSSY